MFKKFALVFCVGLVFFLLMMVLSHNYHYIDQALYPNVYYRNLSQYNALGYGMIHIPTLIFAWLTALTAVVSVPAGNFLFTRFQKLAELSNVESHNEAIVE